MAASWVCFYDFHMAASQVHARAALALAQEMGDQILQAQANTLVGFSTLFVEPGAAEPVLASAAEESRAAGDHHHLAHAVAGLGFSAVHHGRADDALSRLYESLEIARQSGDQVGIRRALAFSGVVLALRGSFADAEVPARQTTSGDSGDTTTLTSPPPFEGPNHPRRHPAWKTTSPAPRRRRRSVPSDRVRAPAVGSDRRSGQRPPGVGT